MEFKPIIFKEIPKTRKELETLRREWKGYDIALRKVGLDVDQIEDNSRRGKSPIKESDEEKIKEKIEEVQKTWKIPKRVKVTTPPGQALIREMTTKPDQLKNFGRKSKIHKVINKHSKNINKDQFQSFHQELKAQRTMIGSATLLVK